MNNIIRKANGGSNMPSTGFSGLVDQLFDQNLNRVFDDSFWGFNGKTITHQVPVNIQETDKTYELQMVAPGFRKEDFKVDIAGDMLTVSLEHKEENKKEDKTNGYLRREFHQQSFSRSFTLDDTIDANKISAKYEQGLLYLSIPKKEGAQRISRSVSIE